MVFSKNQEKHLLLVVTELLLLNLLLVLVVEGQDVDPVKFYGRAIKFKESGLNERYFKKVKSIADKFDGITTVSLYWEDGTIVKTEVLKNLIVGLNGVIQKARTTETEPFGNSYSIIRDEDDTVQISFVLQNHLLIMKIFMDPLKNFQKFLRIMSSALFTALVVAASEDNSDLCEYKIWWTIPNSG